MSQTSFLETPASFASRLRFNRTGLGLTLILGIALSAVSLGTFLTPKPIERAVGSASPLTTDRSAPVSTTTQPPLALPGFQRRGPLLTGEVKTSDGSTLRLVIDTRNHAIVGYRLTGPALAAGTPSR
jgi:hypothetical protein